MTDAIVTDGSDFKEVEKNESLSGNDTVDNDSEAGETPREDPRLAIMQAVADQNDSDREILQGTRQEDMPMGEPVPEFDADDETIASGLDSQVPMYEESKQEDGLPESYADDPLSEFIQMDGDQPMFRTVVNGQQQLIPLEQARASIQKNAAADDRLREAARVSRDLEARETAIRQREAELVARVNEPVPSKDAPAQTNEQLTEKAREVVSELFTGTQDDAAAKLADLLLQNQGAANVATETVDPQQIAAQAVAAARQQLTAEARDADALVGYKKFVKDYPEIAADDMLFRLADGMTDEISQKNPTWMPSEVMLEAGNRTREWAKAQNADKTSEQTPAQTDRQERKRNLRRVPQARQGVQPQEAGERQDTPADFMAEIRESRGQLV
jgi:hypothetical protein